MQPEEQPVYHIHLRDAVDRCLGGLLPPLVVQRIAPYRAKHQQRFDQQP